MELEKKIYDVQPCDVFNPEAFSSGEEDSIEKTTIHEIDPLEDSPIEEVRASIPPTDDPTLPTSTFRAWFWGMVFSAAISFSNQVKYTHHTTNLFLLTF
jgi:hypothetical protein